MINTTQTILVTILAVVQVLSFGKMFYEANSWADEEIWYYPIIIIICALFQYLILR